jgi:hypothetical protein
VEYSGSQLDELSPRNPVSLRNRVSQYLTNMINAIVVFLPLPSHPTTSPPQGQRRLPLA